MMDLNEAITRYHLAGLQQEEMIAYLYNDLKIKISRSTLKRKLKKLGLFRRKNFTDIQRIADFIQNDLLTSNKNNGYRWEHKRLIENGFVVKRETVRTLLKLLDPEGVEERTKKRLKRRIYSSRGANYIWHLDGNDKLKAHGIYTSSCIDGYSRYILWLKAASTNKDPRVITAYYVDALEERGGCPLTVRADLGTENGTIKILQETLRAKYSQSERPAFLYGKSTANQKMEAWWTTLRNHFTQFYIDLFNQLDNDGHFEGTFLDKSLIQFCFLAKIQKDLKALRIHWNTHSIRKTKNTQIPSGKPCNLYFFAERYGGENLLVEITDEQGYQDIRDNFCEYKTYPCNENVYEVCCEIMKQKNLKLPKDAYSALNLYMSLREEILTGNY